MTCAHLAHVVSVYCAVPEWGSAEDGIMFLEERAIQVSHCTVLNPLSHHHRIAVSQWILSPTPQRASYVLRQGAALHRAW